MYRYHEMIINCPQYKTDLVLDTLQAGSPGVASEEVQKGVANEAGPGSTVTCSQIKKGPHGGMAERNLETSFILPLTTIQTSL